MAILKFRVFLEEDNTVYRDVLIRHSQSFAELHQIILKSFEFDDKHQATFYRSNSSWKMGREISLVRYEKEYQAEPLLMKDTLIGSEIFDTNQCFLYQYDFAKNWWFQLQLIAVTKNEDKTAVYPQIARSENIGPPQYGTRSLLGNKFVDIEEKYDLASGEEGFGTEGEGGGAEGETSEPEEQAGEDSHQDDY